MGSCCCKGLQRRRQGHRSAVWVLPGRWLEMSQPHSDRRCQPSTLSHPHFSGKAVISGFLFGPVHGTGYVCSPCMLAEACGEKAQEEKGEQVKGEKECAPRAGSVRSAVSCQDTALSPWPHPQGAGCLRRCSMPRVKLLCVLCPRLGPSTEK